MQQTIYIACALMMLGLMGLSLRDVLVTNDESTYNSLAIVTANTLGHSVLDDISTRRFDRNSATGITDSTLFTPVPHLGIDSAETSGNTKTFNDIDDFGSLDINVATKFGNMRVRCTVYYVTETNTGTASSVRSFFKRADVKISSPYIKVVADSSLTVSRIFAYHG